MPTTTWHNNYQLALMAARIPCAEPGMSMEYACALAAELSWAKLSGAPVRFSPHYLHARCRTEGRADLTQCLDLMRSEGIACAEFPAGDNGDAFESAQAHKLYDWNRVGTFEEISDAVINGDPVVVKILTTENEVLQTTADGVASTPQVGSTAERFAVVAGLRWNMRLREWTLVACFLYGERHGAEGWCFLRMQHSYHICAGYRLRMHVITTKEEE